MLINSNGNSNYNSRSASTRPTSTSTRNTRKHLIISAQALHYNKEISLVQPDWLTSGSLGCECVQWNKNYWLESRYVDTGSHSKKVISTVKTRMQEKIQSQGQSSNSKSSSSSSKPPDVSLTLQWSRISDLTSLFLDRAEKKFSKRMYCHWFYHYGIEEMEFLECFEKCRGVVEEYGGKLV